MNHAHIKPPSPILAFLEPRAALEGMSLFASAPWLACVPRGDSRPVVLAPGFGASESSFRPMKAYLSWLGYEVYDWGLGRNTGKVEEYVHALAERLKTLSKMHKDEPITLIGWSLGGVVMREIARDYPELVREVITMGTPVIGGPKYTRVAESFAEKAKVDMDALEKQIHERNLRGIDCPITAIYSKSDGIVAWRAAQDEYNAQARNIRVPGSHLGLGVNPVVWRIVAKTLGRKQEAPSKQH